MPRWQTGSRRVFADPDLAANQRDTAAEPAGIQNRNGTPCRQLRCGRTCDQTPAEQRRPPPARAHAERLQRGIRAYTIASDGLTASG